MAKKITGRLRRGVCRTCGCTHTTPCVKVTSIGYVTCAWTDRTQTQCTFCRPTRRTR